MNLISIFKYVRSLFFGLFCVCVCVCVCVCEERNSPTIYPYDH